MNDVLTSDGGLRREILPFLRRMCDARRSRYLFVLSPQLDLNTFCLDRKVISGGVEQTAKQPSGARELGCLQNLHTK